MFCKQTTQKQILRILAYIDELYQYQGEYWPGVSITEESVPGATVRVPTKT